MTSIASIRCSALLAALAGAAVCVCVSVPASAQSPTYRQRSTPAPIERRPPSSPTGQQSPAGHQQPAAPPIQRSQPPVGKLPNGEHLRGWFEQHNNQTSAQKLQALEREPGFHDLPPQTQQRMRERLTELNNMPPDQRAKMFSRTEAMERLNPEQRGQVRSAMQQWASLPPASYRVVGRTFRIVRGMPPAQRLAYLNSPAVRSQFNDQERDTLMHLMAIEPYLPPRNPADPNQ
jgi:uncharacterized membrane protein